MNLVGNDVMRELTPYSINTNKMYEKQQTNKLSFYGHVSTFIRYKHLFHVCYSNCVFVNIIAQLNLSMWDLL